MDSLGDACESRDAPRRLALVIRIVLVLAAVPVIFVGVQQSVARADAPETITTRLEPGINYVGWVSADTPVEEFFTAVPQVEAVFAWSARNEEWLRAAPGVSAEFNTLRWLTPGMGLVVRVGGDEPVEWTRAFSRPSALIGLRSGMNLVAWTGGRATLLSEIERDLRRSFRAQYAEPGANTPDRLYTPDQPETVDAFGRVEHGGAFWVRAEVLGSWSQRSDAHVLIRGRVIGPDGEGIEGLYVQATITSRRGWYFPYITGSDGSFRMLVLVDSKYTISFQHRDGCSSYYREGGTTEELASATRIDTSESVDDLEFRVGDGACGRYIRGTLIDATGVPIAGQLVSAQASIPARGGYDRTAEDGSFEIFVPDNVEYVLKANAAAGCDAWFDGDGLSREREAAAKISVSGEDVPGVQIRVPADICAWEIRGRVSRHDGSPYPSVRVLPIAPDRRHVASVYTSEDGSFLITLPQPGQYRLEIWTNDDCDGFYADGALVTALEDASTIDVSDDRAAEVVLRMPEASCAWQIRGRLTGADGTAIAYTRVAARGANGDVDDYSRTDADGAFAFTPRADEAFTLSAEVGETCLVYRSDDGISLSNADATRFRRGDPDLTKVDFRLPAGVCEVRIRGRIVWANGEPLGNASITIDGDGWYEYGRTQTDGSFDLHLPVEGVYRLGFTLAPGCRVGYDGETLSTSAPSGAGVQAVSARTTNLTIRIPEFLCSLQIRGTLIDSDGKPVAGWPVYADSVDDRFRTVGSSDLDGSFAVTVPLPTSYRVLALTPGQCRVYYREAEIAGELADATVVVVGDASVEGLVVRMPERPSCRWRISGMVVDADNSGLADVQVGAQSTDGVVRTSRTNADGSFVMQVSGDDDYVLEVVLKHSCWTYFDGVELTALRQDAATVRVPGGNLTNLTLRVPHDVCRWRVSGQVTEAGGTPLADVTINLDGAEGAPGYGHTDANGVFVSTVPKSDDYRLRLRVDRCPLFYDGTGVTPWVSDRAYIRVAGADVSGITIRVPDDLCVRQIRGRVFDANGAPWVNPSVWAYGRDIHYIQGHRAADGSFSFRVPTAGEYRIAVEVGGCTWWVTEQGVSAQGSEASRVRVGDQDLTGIEIHLPDEPERACK